MAQNGIGPLGADGQSPSRRAVIHIGTHKTGTTAFQQCTRRAIEPLRASGIHLLESEAGPGHDQDLAKLVVRPELIMKSRAFDPDAALPTKRAENWHRIRRQVESDWPTVLVSLEDLSYARTTAEVSALAELFEGRVVTLVVALRTREGYLESMRSQLRRMYLPDRSPYPDSMSYTEPDSWLVDYDTLVAVFEAGFGPLTILDYDACIAERGSIVPDLWRACHLPLDAMPAEWTAWENISPGDLDTENLLAAMSVSRGLTPPERLHFRTVVRNLESTRRELTELRTRPRAQLAALRTSLPVALRVRLQRLREQASRHSPRP
jgi:hypothetical protein